MRKKAFGTYAIAKICHVAPITVGRWIDEGKIPFLTTGGGHRRVWADDLVKFLKAHNYPLPPHLNGMPQTTFLIVDDEAPTRRMMRRILQSNYHDVQIDEAVDGFEAGEKVAALVPSLVILDIHLPGIDGYKVCERIRKNKTYKNVRILAVSGDHHKETQSKIIKAGADDFLAKPFNADELLLITQKLLRLN